MSDMYNYRCNVVSLDGSCIKTGIIDLGETLDVS